MKLAAQKSNAGEAKVKRNRLLLISGQQKGKLPAFERNRLNPVNSLASENMEQKHEQKHEPNRTEAEACFSDRTFVRHYFGYIITDSFAGKTGAT